MSKEKDERSDKDGSNKDGNKLTAAFVLKEFAAIKSAISALRDDVETLKKGTVNDGDEDEDEDEDDTPAWLR